MTIHHNRVATMSMPGMVKEDGGVPMPCMKKEEPVKCYKRGCKATEGLKTCFFNHCDRYLCAGCAKDVYEKNESRPFVVDGDDVFVCCKRHLNAVKAALDKSDPSKHVPWSEDSKDGIKDPKNSENLLISWMTTGNNYERYCGDKYGKSKVQFAQEIADRINAAGVRKTRTADDVRKKIANIEARYKQAYDFATTETGAGLQSANDGSFEEALNKRCPQFSLLESILGDRVKFKPKLTSDDLFGVTVVDVDNEVNNTNDDDNSINLINDNDDDNDDDVDENKKDNDDKKKIQTKGVGTDWGASRKRSPLPATGPSMKKRKNPTIADTILQVVSKMAKSQAARKKAPPPAAIAKTPEQEQAEADLAKTKQNLELVKELMYLRKEVKMADSEIAKEFPAMRRFLSLGGSTGSIGGTGGTAIGGVGVGVGVHTTDTIGIGIFPVLGQVSTSIPVPVLVA